MEAKGNQLAEAVTLPHLHVKIKILMRSILQNVHCSQGRLLTQQKRSSHRLTKLTLQKRNRHGPEEGNFDPTTQMRFRPNLKSRQHTASRLGTTAVTPACISFNSACTWENGSWGKQYFRKLSYMVAHGTHYIIARVLLRHLNPTDHGL